MTYELATDKRLALALDTDDLEKAIRWAGEVKGIFGVVKVGLQLFASQGPSVTRRLLDMGFEVFLDLKFYDIPNTVENASRVVGELGVSYLTVHSAGGVDMVKAALNGLREGADRTGNRLPRLLGVTVLTSFAAASEADLAERVSILIEAGADGLVCAPTDLEFIRSHAPGFIKVVPGIRRPNDALGDQARVASPEAAIAAGADVLVIGRPVTASENPRKTAMEIRSSVEFARK